MGVQQEKSITPNWVMRLMGAGSAVFRLIGSDIEVVTSRGESYEVLVDTLANAYVLKEGLFFSRLLLKTTDGEKAFPESSKEIVENYSTGCVRIYSGNWLRRLSVLLKIFGGCCLGILAILALLLPKHWLRKILSAL